jgi:hypothetical protein
MHASTASHSPVAKPRSTGSIIESSPLQRRCRAAMVERNQVRATKVRIQVPMARFAPEWRTYCVYSGHHLPGAAITSEHVIPRALGGKGATTIPCSSAVNSRIGHEIDTKVTNDPMIIFGRRDTDMRGNSLSLSQTY